MNTFKRTVARGFTLIELLIVVIIVAILAAIAIPQFSANTADAQLAAMDANLSTLRTAMEQYRAQHTGNVYPGAVASTAGTQCPGGGNSIAAAVGATAMLEQLRGYTNTAGVVCASPGGDFRFGPYLRQGIPTEPFSNSADVAISAAAPLAAAADGAGWMYNTTTGQIIVNSTAADGVTANRTRAQH